MVIKAVKKERPGVLLRGKDMKKIERGGEEQMEIELCWRMSRRSKDYGVRGKGVGGVRHTRPVAQLVRRITGRAR